MIREERRKAHGIPTEPPRGVGWVALTGGVQCILRDCTPVETRQLKAKGVLLIAAGHTHGQADTSATRRRKRGVQSILK